jgi:hypothetical protein
LEVITTSSSEVNEVLSCAIVLKALNTIKDRKKCLVIVLIFPVGTGVNNYEPSEME